MAVQEFSARVRHKRDTSANWTTNDPVLLDGEVIIVDTDDGAVRTKTGDGVKTYTKLPFDDEAVRGISIAIQESLDTHAADKSNPHEVTAAQIGAVPTSRTVNGKALTENITLAATDVGLGNVDNTSDANKPISTATQAALNLKAPLDSPALTGTPTVPTATESSDGRQIANKEFVLANAASIETPISIANGGTGQTSALNAALALGRGWGTCATAAATSAKVVTLSGFVRNVGAVVGVRFTYANTATSPTLNVNGTGATLIYDGSTGAIPVSGAMVAGTHFFQFSGTQWVLLNPASAKIATGSYTGTGTYGSSNPNSLTFPFTPKIVFLSQSTLLSSSDFFYGFGSAILLYASNTYGIYLTWSGSSVSWYSTYQAAIYQLNYSGYVYNWIAIG